MKKLLVNLAKIAISLLILALLCYKGWQSLQAEPTALDELVNKPKHWTPIIAAVLLFLVAAVVTILRWRLLVQALGMAFPVRDALRLGFVGYLLNFTLSIVGGDLIKAIAIAHRNPGRQAAAAATVVVDRIVGIYALFIVAAVASLLLTRLEIADDAQRVVVQRICWSIQAISIGSTVGFVLMLLPGLATSPWWELLGKVPKIGPALLSVLEAVRMYRRQPGLLLLAIAISLTTHSMYGLAIYLVGVGLPGPDPPVVANFIVTPVAMSAGAAPLPGGLGAFEATFVFMYQALSPSAVSPVQGLVIAVVYRIITLIIAAVGGAYYLLDRREVKELMDEAKEEEVPH